MDDSPKSPLNSSRPLTPKSKKEIVQRKYVKKETFTWTSKQQRSFDAVKSAISENAMAGADPELQYHLAVDASGEAIGAKAFVHVNINIPRSHYQ